MKSLTIIVCLFVMIGCSKENQTGESWTLISYSNIQGQFFGCEYEPGEIVWTFGENVINIDGRLIPPFGLRLCYDSERDFILNTIFLKTMGPQHLLEIPALGLNAKVIKWTDELIIKVISSESFYPDTEGCKVLFRKI